LLAGDDLAAPQLILAEVASALRRRQLAAEITSGVATIAHYDLLRMPIALHDYHELAERIWQLRDNVTVYDAWYIALAEALDASLATLDTRLARAPGVRCPIVTPPA
jgi:predicted nucleic acid-binding protein